VAVLNNMNTKPDSKDGGPAFPVTPPRDVTFTAGMSLRDYFAAAALTGICSSGTLPSDAKASQWAYEYADALLAARERKEG
jgi:hypothetical protein